jgi:hypothetical protein
MWEATPELRWCHMTSGRIVLQQQWAEMISYSETDNGTARPVKRSTGKVEWRDVPTVMHEGWRE